jgi:hypothetical protein
MLIPRPAPRLNDAIEKIRNKNISNVSKRHAEIAVKQRRIAETVQKAFEPLAFLVHDVDKVKVQEIVYLVSSELQQQLWYSPSAWNSIQNKIRNLDPWTFSLEQFAVACNMVISRRMRDLAQYWRTFIWEAKLHQYVEKKGCGHYQTGNGDEIPE